MKRAWSGTIDEYELRDKKIRRKVPLLELVQALSTTDVWKQIMLTHRELNWSEAWFAGKLQFFRCIFDCGDVMYSEWYFSEASMRFFNTWWKFLTTVKKMKRESGMWEQLTISSAEYWQVNSLNVHKFESFHLGISEVQEYTDPDLNVVALLASEENGIELAESKEEYEMRICAIRK